jgi:hypothetical protein
MLSFFYDRPACFKESAVTKNPPPVRVSDAVSDPRQAAKTAWGTALPKFRHAVGLAICGSGLLALLADLTL